MIEIKNFTKIIRGAAVLKNINLTLESGKIYGLWGKNGSGKTMLMRAICGLILPTEGYVSIDGERLGGKNSFPKSVGALIENPAFLDSKTGFENLLLLAEIKGEATKDDVAGALEKVGLEPHDRRKYRKYSLGMKQRLGIAAAIMENPQILLLDEPFNALDPSGAEMAAEIIKKFKEKGATIVIACHDRDELENLADEIVRVERGAAVDEES